MGLITDKVGVLQGYGWLLEYPVIEHVSYLIVKHSRTKGGLNNHKILFHQMLG